MELNPEYAEVKEEKIPEEIILRHRGYREINVDRRKDPWSSDKDKKIYIGFFCDVLCDYLKINPTMYNMEGGSISEADHCSIQHRVGEDYREVKIARLDGIRYFIQGLDRNADLEGFANAAPHLLDEYFDRIKNEKLISS